MCVEIDCVKTLAMHPKQLVILFENLVVKTRRKTKAIADCLAGTEMNLVTALGF